MLCKRSPACWIFCRSNLSRITSVRCKFTRMRGLYFTVCDTFVWVPYEGSVGAKFACQCRRLPKVISRNAMSPMWKNIYSCYLMYYLVQQIKDRHRNLHLNLQVCLSRRNLTDFFEPQRPSKWHNNYEIIRIYSLKQLNFRACFSMQCFWKVNHASLLGTPL